MKKIIRLTILATIIGIALINRKNLWVVADRWLNFSFCDRSMTYKVGAIDPKFNVSRENVLQNAVNASQLWNQVVQNDLFVYDTGSVLEIDLVFDERQGSLQMLSKQEELLDEKKEDYLINKQQLEQKRSELEERLTKLNDEISYWNEKDGAPEEIYYEIIDRQETLNKEIDEIYRAADRLNLQMEKVNQEVDSVNQAAARFDNILSVKPEGGIYDPSRHRIEIYIFENDQDLINIISHELGHALGLDHVDEEGSIMNANVSPESHVTQSDIEAISQFCTQQNRLDLIEHDLKNLIFILMARMDSVVT